MLTWAPSLPTHMILWVLLLIPASLSIQKREWDNITCTKGVVSVSRGERAVMDCNISNPLSHITICLNVPRSPCQTIFNETAPGHFFQGGWQLRVLEGMAQLVTENAQATQAGKYRWHLAGYQRTAGITVLNVSEPPELPFIPTLSWDSWTLPSRLNGTGQSQSRAHTVPVLFFILFSILGLGMFLWYRRPRFFRFRQLLQN